MPRELASKAGPAPQGELGRVLVVGAGVAGIRASLDLAESGCQVTLIDASPALGGVLSQLEHQFPDNHCGMCRMLPEVGQEQSSLYCMRKGLFHERIEILPFTSVAAVRGEPGAFELELLTRPRRIRADACAGCAAPCVGVCPVEVPEEFNLGLTRRKAIFRPVPYNLPDTLCIDDSACNRCGECVKVCPASAIDLDAADTLVCVFADAVILALGSRLYRPGDDPESAAWQTLPNVVTSLQLERLLSLTGRRGTLRRPSDGKPVERIGWLQCIGSRDRKHEHERCSSVCCMFALKEATLVREAGGPRPQADIFYMDMRVWGKGFHRYRLRAEELGVRLRRGRVHEVAPMADGALRLHWMDPSTGAITNELFDMLVLSTGSVRGEGSKRLASLFGLEEPAVGQSAPIGFEPAKSSRPGVFVCGVLAGKADIAGSIVSATAAASEASKLLFRLGRRFEAEPPMPAVRDVSGEEPHVAVVLCRCQGGAVQQAAELEVLSAKLAGRRGVAGVHIVDSPCEAEGRGRVAAILADQQYNRVLFGACLPYVYKRALVRVAEEAGLPAALVKVVDAVGRQRSAPGSAALAGVLRTLEMAIEELKAGDPHKPIRVSVTQRVLVVGGGIAGIRAALSLAERGVDVDLVEKSDRLGGTVRSHVHGTLAGNEPRALVSELEELVSRHPRIGVHLRASAVRSLASVGRRETVIRERDGEEKVIAHGATILATGAREAATREYGYGASDRVITLAELERGLASGALDAADMNVVVMLQCVGSRESGGRQYCSRVCCAGALKNALRIRAGNPAARLFVLYRDMMATGAWEHAYNEARSQGVLFATYGVEDKPTVQVVDGRPRVGFTDPVLGRRIEVAADWVVLSTGMEPDATSAETARVFGAERNDDGFFAEASSKWRPVDCLQDGIFLAGTAHSPQAMEEALAQAEACAQRVFTTLSREVVTVAGAVSDVHDALCARCRTCVGICPVHARELDAAAGCIVVDPLRCRACGLCAAACPNSAARIAGMGERQVMAAVEAALDDALRSLGADDRGAP